jgi:hypothetical protein
MRKIELEFGAKSKSWTIISKYFCQIDVSSTEIRLSEKKKKKKKQSGQRKPHPKKEID